MFLPYLPLFFYTYFTAEGADLTALYLGNLTWVSFLLIHSFIRQYLLRTYRSYMYIYILVDYGSRYRRSLHSIWKVEEHQILWGEEKWSIEGICIGRILFPRKLKEGQGGSQRKVIYSLLLWLLLLWATVIKIENYSGHLDWILSSRLWSCLLICRDIHGKAALINFVSPSTLKQLTSSGGGGGGGVGGGGMPKTGNMGGGGGMNRPTPTPPSGGILPPYQMG